MTITVEFRDGSTFVVETGTPVWQVVAAYMAEHAEKTVDDLVSVRRD